LDNAIHTLQNNIKIQMRLIVIILIVLILDSCSQGSMTQKEVKVDLRGRHLKEIPDSVFQNPEITYLDLGSSNVVFYPPLSSLSNSNYNEISFLSEEIGKLTKLKTLILNTNKLTTLPNSITKLINLEVLDLSININLNIVQELDKLKKLPKLKVLKIIDVNLTRNNIVTVQSVLKPSTRIILDIREYADAAN
jgi:Leucine-rich repeat (LRR) protein